MADFRIVVCLLLLPLVVSSSQLKRGEWRRPNRPIDRLQPNRKEDSSPNRSPIDLQHKIRGASDSNQPLIDMQSRKMWDSGLNRSPINSQPRRGDNSARNRPPADSQSRREDPARNRPPADSQPRREDSGRKRPLADLQHRRREDSGRKRPPAESQPRRENSGRIRPPADFQLRRGENSDRKRLPVEFQPRRREHQGQNRAKIDLQHRRRGRPGPPRRTCNREDPTPIRDIKLLSIQGRWFAPNLIFSKTIPEYRSLNNVSDFSLDFNASGVVILDASVSPPWTDKQRVCIYEKVFFHTLDARKNAFIMHSKFFNRTMEWRLLKTDWGRSYLLTWTCVLKINGVCADFMSHIHSRTPHYLTQGQLQKINRYVKRTLCLDYRDYTADPLRNRCKRYKDLIRLSDKAKSKRI